MCSIYFFCFQCKQVQEIFLLPFYLQDQQDFSFRNNLVAEDHMEPVVNMPGYMHGNDKTQIKSSIPSGQVLQSSHNNNMPMLGPHTYRLAVLLYAYFDNLFLLIAPVCCFFDV